MTSDRAVSLNMGFIISAKSSMIGDNPDVQEIAHDMRFLSIALNGKSILLPEYVVSLSIARNEKRIKSFFSIQKKQIIGYKLEITDYSLTKAVKTGTVLKNGAVVSTALLSLNNSHPVIYSRDFIGYFFEFCFSGVAWFLVPDNGNPVRCKFSFSRIPILAFKSENSKLNAASEKISKQIFYDIVKRKNVEVKFI